MSDLHLLQEIQPWTLKPKMAMNFGNLQL